MAQCLRGFETLLPHHQIPHRAFALQLDRINNHTYVVIKMKRIKNEYTEKLIKELKTLAIKEERPLWKRIATELERPTRKKREVNIFKLEHTAREGEIVIVPGKVLGNGAINKKLTVAALDFSQGAREKILSHKGEALSIEALMKKNPGANNVRIMG
ncbi:MAG: 50S ribosomal protein L18e [Nanoarchaeota archaeon]